MQFNNSQAIYLQIAEYVYDSVLSGAWKPGDRVPSVRDLAESLEVNPNTVMRTFSLLQEEGILYNQRGIGYFLTVEAMTQVRKVKKAAFYDAVLPYVFRTMKLLDVSSDDIAERYAAFCAEPEVRNENK